MADRGDGSRDYEGVARDRAGNRVSSVLRLNFDTIAPTIVATPDRQPDVDGKCTAPVTISFACADELSGIATCPDPIRLATNGTGIVVPGTDTDRAGNSATTSVTINLEIAAPPPANHDPSANAGGPYAITA